MNKVQEIPINMPYCDILWNFKQKSCLFSDNEMYCKVRQAYIIPLKQQYC